MNSTTKQTSDTILTRGVEEVIVRDVLQKALESSKKLRVKLGIDPTSSNIHLGRAVSLLKLRDFQERGHTIVLIIGDFTGIIGDTSDKESERPMLSREEIESNQETYFKQIGLLLDLDTVEKHYNSRWLGKLTYRDIGEQADRFSVADFISRENIKRRLEGGTRVSLREMLYPLMQGYDSVAVKADVEIGGIDQKFNLLAGRTLQEKYDQKPQNIIMNPLILGLDGRKMSSSFGNSINLTDTSNDMFGKVMRMHDDSIIEYFTLCTRVSLEEIDVYKKELEENKVNPRDIKMRLATEIVTLYHGKKMAGEAEEQFVETFSKKGVPEDIEELVVKRGVLLLDLLITKNVVATKNEFRRLINENAVTDLITNEKVTDPTLVIKNSVTLRIGKKRFVKITVE